VRIGGGLRYASSASLHVTGAGASFANGTDLKASTSAVLEGEYVFGEHFGITLRFVSEKYKYDRTGAKVDGDHVGLGFNYHF
jgi:hypothetical protein